MFDTRLIRTHRGLELLVVDVLQDLHLGDSKTPFQGSVRHSVNVTDDDALVVTGVKVKS
jgi:hypothetical protein